jgi:hypothetical protein
MGHSPSAIVGEFPHMGQEEHVTIDLAIGD